MMRDAREQNSDAHAQEAQRRRGRPAGRPNALKLPSDFRRVILRVAEQSITINVAGDPTAMTLFRANFLWLATAVPRTACLL
jgi:hypothetical protein